MDINNFLQTKNGRFRFFEKKTMAEIIDFWLASKKQEVKKSTYEYYKRTCTNIFMVKWDKYNSKTVHENVLQELIDDINNDYAAKTLRDICVIGNQILFFAYEKGFTKINACKKIKIPQARQIPDVLSCDEQKKFTDFLLADPDTAKVGILICLYTGLRLGELCGLRWEDIDLSVKRIKIRRTIQKINNDFHIDTPKTLNSERIIPIPSFLYDVLKKFQADDTLYVASGSRDFMQPRTYQYKLKRYLQDCGLPEHHFHSLRHTFASRAVELGFDLKSLSEILGHSNVKVTLDLYVHPSMDVKMTQMELFSKFI